MYEYKPLPFKEVKSGRWGGGGSTGSPAHWGGAIGKISHHHLCNNHLSPFLGVTGGQREAGTGAGWPCCLFCPRRGGEGSSRHPPRQSVATPVAAGDCPLHPWEGPPPPDFSVQYSLVLALDKGVWFEQEEL